MVVSTPPEMAKHSNLHTTTLKPWAIYPLTLRLGEAIFTLPYHLQDYYELDIILTVDSLKLLTAA